MTTSNKVIVALDSNNFEEISELLNLIRGHVFGIKIGYEFFLNFGLQGYKKVLSNKFNIFLDLKLHDIPNTVEKSIDVISSLKPYFTTIHISGGDKMIQAAIIKKKQTKILGVSALTSLDDKQINKYYSRKNVNKLVTDYTYYALENKLDGIVCSPHEIKTVKKIANTKLIIVTPGIRYPAHFEKDDQTRIMGPGKAISLGADYVVIGRPITKSREPKNKIIEINLEIAKYQN